MANPTISLFDQITQTTNGGEIEINTFLEYTRNGKWQDIVLPVRTLLSKTTDKKERSNIKKNVPYVTISGKFDKRENKGLIEHSGFICVDIDKQDNPQFSDVNEMKNAIKDDKYCYSVYTSISGEGLAVLIKIDPLKHNEAFEGLQEYFYSSYTILVDACPDVSRARFVSVDPYLILHTSAQVFKKYLKKKAQPKIEKVVYSPGDFEDLINQVIQGGLNVCDSYHEWLRCGFALADKFGESGRTYFHAISNASAKYDYNQCDKQYDSCINRGKSGITISSLYYYFKRAGLQLYTKTTQLIASSATAAWKGGGTIEDTIKNLEKHEGLTPDQTTDIVKQVFNNKIAINTDDSEFALIKNWLRHNYDFRRNLITNYIENSGNQMQDEDFNSIYCRLKEIYGKANYQDLLKIIHSDFVPGYNPLKNFINLNKDRNCTGTISALCKCVKTNNPYFEYFFRKWLIGIIASIYGGHCRLMVVLTGAQNIGKSQFFIRLLPEELKGYFAMIKWVEGKDDDIAMTCKLLILDDELESHDKKTNGQLKAIISAPSFYVRLPYGKTAVDLPRLATLCGTSNPTNILTDPTGNTRIIPANVISIDFDAYNAIDKTSLLIEAYNLYKAGEKWDLNKEDILKLNSQTSEFENYTIEYELINKYFKVPDPGNNNVEKLTATDIKVELETKSANQKLSLDKVGKELQRIGFKQNPEKIYGKTKRLYEVERLHPLHPFTPI